VLILVTLDDLLLLKDFKSVLLLRVLLLNEKHFAIRAFANDTDGLEVFGTDGPSGYHLGGHDLLVLLDFFFSLSNLSGKRD